ncbi:hypothetical protein EDB19DRAFT_1628405, partial [Suillus lakei]
FRASALTEGVQRALFCAQANMENSGSDCQPPTNHWMLFLEIQDPARSVQGDSPGTIVLEMIKSSVLDQSVLGS